MTPYEQGFRKRAEELGVDPDSLVKEGGQLWDWLTGKAIHHIDRGTDYVYGRLDDGFRRARPHLGRFRRKAIAALSGRGDGSLPLLEDVGNGARGLYRSARGYYDSELMPFGRQIAKSISDIGNTRFWRNSVVPAGKAVTGTASTAWDRVKGFMNGKLPFND